MARLWWKQPPKLSLRLASDYSRLHRKRAHVVYIHCECHSVVHCISDRCVYFFLDFVWSSELTPTGTNKQVLDCYGIESSIKSCPYLILDLHLAILSDQSRLSPCCYLASFSICVNMSWSSINYSYWHFYIVRIVDCVLLVTDAAPNAILRACNDTDLTSNYIHRLTAHIVLYELPWQFGLCAFACYLFGIAHTVSNVCCLRCTNIQ